MNKEIAVATAGIVAECAAIIAEFETLCREYEESQALLDEQELHLLHLLYDTYDEDEVVIKKRCYKPSNSELWEDMIPNFTESQFKEHFRMNRDTFEMIVSKVGHRMVTVDTQMRKHIPVSMKVAIGLKVLSSNCEYREIATMFGVGKTTVHDCFKSFLYSAEKDLVPEFIQWPTQDQFKRMAVDFEQRWQYPMAVGAVDGCHLRISVPSDNKTDYCNYKGHYSILSLCICDSNYQFYYVKSGIPGCTTDAGAFQCTSIFERGSKDLFPESERRIENVVIPYHLLGDGAFPLEPWLMKMYHSQFKVTEDEQVFNRRHSRAREVIKNAFGRLKGRWRRLLKDPLEVKLEDASKVIVVAAALHNICQKRRIPYDDCNTEDGQLYGSLEVEPSAGSQQAKEIRNALKGFFSSQSFQPWDEDYN